ncbi:hypothetical protein RIF29_21305 [Crotalaria pallida]|uniref:ubiquitinyl hydrolase 1 n=1 Tax=Crotalaria pallida TaxID=3830 RepID=A0AAN9F2R6_CROPI
MDRSTTVSSPAQEPLLWAMAAATMEKENPTLSSSSTTSSFTCEWNYDVFISFRGADTRSDIQKIPYLHDSDMDLSQHHGVRLNKKLDKEQTRKEKAEAHLYTIIKVALDADLYEQIGKDLYFDLVDHDKVRRFRIPKQTPFTLFKEEVAREFGIPVIYQRFWFWAKRQNQSYRPNRPLMPQEETQSVGQLAEQVSNKANNAELKLFLELEIGQDFGLIPPPEKSKEDLLLFFKLYDPLHEKLCYIGRFYVPASGKPMDILTRLKEMAGFSLDEEIELFKEIKFDPRDMCERVGKDFPFRASELEDGDIICYQKACEVGNGVPFRYRDVPSFLKYAYNHKTSHKYHEVLDLTTLKIAFHHATEDDVVIHTIRLPKKSVVVDVINDLKSKVDLSHPAAELRLLRISDHKIMKIFSIREKIEDITKYGTIRAEEIPEEEKNLGTDDKLIHVYHFKTYIEQNQQHIQNFGHPFFLVIHKHEELVHIKLRIQKKFRVPYDEILKWKFASVRFHRSKYLHKSVYDEFKKGSTYGDWEQYLGLEHGD